MTNAQSKEEEQQQPSQEIDLELAESIVQAEKLLVGDSTDATTKLNMAGDEAVVIDPIIQGKKSHSCASAWRTSSWCITCNIRSRINALLEDQDKMQKYSVGISASMELYRVLVSSLLILFVPQDCGAGSVDDGAATKVCSYSENMESAGTVYSAGLALNFVTLGVILLMYAIEIKRENRLISYLEVNKNLPFDNESVGYALEKGLSKERRESILSLDSWFQRIGALAMLFFVANVVLSGIVVYDYSLGSQTTSTFVTNVLFMTDKMSNVYFTIATDKNILLSSYMKSKVQFNDVDPDKKEAEIADSSDIEDDAKVFVIEE